MDEFIALRKVTMIAVSFKFVTYRLINSALQIFAMLIVYLKEFFGIMFDLQSIDLLISNPMILFCPHFIYILYKTLVSAQNAVKIGPLS